MKDWGVFSPPARALIDRVVQVAESDPRVIGLTLGGSAVAGGIDEFSDLDFVVVCMDEHHPAVLSEARRFAERVGPLLTSFTGEHVGEPRLLVVLYGPPVQHVDLKFVAVSDLEHRVEDGIVVWEREPGVLGRAMAASGASWPQPDLQWIEDRFWVWVHYLAGRIGRGELFECLDGFAYLRTMIFGPLLATAHGQRPQGVRRLERYAGGVLPELEETVGDHTREGCLRALRASIRLYRRLRDEADDGRLVRRTEAEAASLDYLDHVGQTVR
jgi:predicted nucleotidyltransferase